MALPVAAILALVLVVGVTACGGGDPLPAGSPDGPGSPGLGASPGPTPTPTPIATPTPTPMPTPTPTPTPAPTELFAGLPVFPGSRVVALDLSRWTATYRTEASLATVAAYYDRTLPEQGWRIEDRDTDRNEVEYEVERGDDEANVRLRAVGGGETEIRLDRD